MGASLSAHLQPRLAVEAIKLAPIVNDRAKFAEVGGAL